MISGLWMQNSLQTSIDNPMNAEFNSIFARLRMILEPYSRNLEISADAPDHYCLDVAFSPKFQKGFPAAWVKIGKAYVSYHFMPVYMFPKLKDGMSSKLQARMQGKSCFNFKTSDESLFKELERLTREGFELCRKTGIAPGERIQVHQR
jgi:hypothetical protein